MQRDEGRSDHSVSFFPMPSARAISHRDSFLPDLHFLSDTDCPTLSFEPLMPGLLRLSSATLTPKRSAISSSVSPLRTEYFFRELLELRLDFFASPFEL